MCVWGSRGKIQLKETRYARINLYSNRWRMDKRKENRKAMRKKCKCIPLLLRHASHGCRLRSYSKAGLNSPPSTLAGAASGEQRDVLKYFRRRRWWRRRRHLEQRKCFAGHDGGAGGMPKVEQASCRSVLMVSLYRFSGMWCRCKPGGGTAGLYG